MLWMRPDQAACFFSPSVNVTPRITSARSLSEISAEASGPRSRIESGRCVGGCIAETCEVAE